MKPSLTAGITGSASYPVTADMSPPHLPDPVLSTPSMILLIEMTCLHAIEPHLDQGETTVGTHVCVSHVAKAEAGEVVQVSCTVTEVDRRRVELATRVSCGDRLLSEGTHQRFVVRPDR